MLERSANYVLSGDQHCNRNKIRHRVERQRAIKRRRRGLHKPDRQFWSRQSIGIERAYSPRIWYEQFQQFDLLHCEIEDRLLRLIEKLEQKRDHDDCVGHISEVASADPPHRPGGCPFQAWSVA